MFGWLKKRNAAAEEPPPQAAPAENPQPPSRFTVAVQGPAGEREEEIDLVQILSQVFTSLGRDHAVQDENIVDSESGLEFQPGLVEFQPRDDLSMQTCTIISIRHVQKIPKSVFEYQHSLG